jgi:hypothetical protein
MKRKLLVVKCKTEGCSADLKVGETPPDEPQRGVYHVLERTLVPSPGRLTCPDCKQTHDYKSEDVDTKTETAQTFSS